MTVTLSNLAPGFPTDQRNGDKEFVIRRAATNRVLNVLRHWVSKHSQVRFTFTLYLFLCFFLSSCAFEGKLHFCNDYAVVPQDFELNTELKMRVIGFLEEVMHDPELLTQERKAAANIIRLVFRYQIAHTVIYDTSVCQHPLRKRK